MASVKSHDHDQSVAASTWNIEHNLGTMTPVLDTFIDFEGAVRKILPADVIVVDANNVQVVFTTPRSGKVALRG